MAVIISEEFRPLPEPKVLKSCLDCPNHKVIPDPDPNDRFNDDDKAVVCLGKRNDKQDTASKWVSNRNPYEVVEPSIRPYNLEKEATVPDWCPMGNTPYIKSYTIAEGLHDICSDIIYESATQADSEAKENGVKAFSFDWDGKSAQTIINVKEV